MVKENQNQEVKDENKEGEVSTKKRNFAIAAFLVTTGVFMGTKIGTNRANKNVSKSLSELFEINPALREQMIDTILQYEKKKLTSKGK